MKQVRYVEIVASTPGHSPLMEAVTKSRIARDRARKQVRAVISGGSRVGKLSIEDALREHALATAEHNRATKEFRDYHLNGQVPGRPGYVAAGIHDRLFGTELAEDMSVAV